MSQPLSPPYPLQFLQSGKYLLRFLYTGHHFASVYAHLAQDLESYSQYYDFPGILKHGNSDSQDYPVEWPERQRTVRTIAERWKASHKIYQERSVGREEIQCSRRRAEVFADQQPAQIEGVIPPNWHPDSRTRGRPTIPTTPSTSPSPINTPSPALPSPTKPPVSANAVILPALPPSLEGDLYHSSSGNSHKYMMAGTGGTTDMEQLINLFKTLGESNKPAVKATELGFFWPDAPLEHGIEATFTHEGKTMYRNVAAFTNRIRVKVGSTSGRQVKGCIDTSLMGEVQTWWNNGIEESSRIGVIAADIPDLLIQKLLDRFKPPPSEAINALYSTRYTIQHCQDQYSVAKYIGHVQVAAQTAGVIGDSAIVAFAWKQIDVALRRDLPEPVAGTTLE